MENREQLCGGYTKYDLARLLLSGELMTFWLGNFPQKGKTIRGRLNSIALEDGSHESWLLSGYTQDGKNFRAWFHTRRGTGWIEVLSN